MGCVPGGIMGGRFSALKKISLALFMVPNSVAPMSLITFYLMCSPYWNSSVLTIISLAS